METFLGILVIAAIIGGMILWNKATSAATNKATTFLRPKDHQAGQELVAQKHWFSTKASVANVKQAIVDQVHAQLDVPNVKAALYLEQASDSLIVYQYGTRFQTVFRVFVQLQPSADGGARGSYEIANWLLVNGLVTRQKEMKQLLADIEMALKRVDSTATIRVAA